MAEAVCLAESDDARRSRFRSPLRLHTLTVSVEVAGRRRLRAQQVRQLRKFGPHMFVQRIRGFTREPEAKDRIERRGSGGLPALRTELCAGLKLGATARALRLNQAASALRTEASTWPAGRPTALAYQPGHQTRRSGSFLVAAAMTVTTMVAAPMTATAMVIASEKSLKKAHSILACSVGLDSRWSARRFTPSMPCQAGAGH